jgi:putative hydrolase of the HAD superfamily
VVAFDGDDTLWSADATLDWERELDALAGECLPKRNIDADILARVRTHGFTIQGIQHALHDALVANKNDGLPSGWERRVRDLPTLARALDLRALPGGDRALDDVQAAGRQAWIVTKGRALTQALKVARLECSARFSVVEVVAAKDRRTYKGLLQRHIVEPKDFGMVGDSLFEDVIPPVLLGCSAAYIPAGKARVLRPLGMLGRSGRMTLCASLKQACDKMLTK